MSFFKRAPETGIKVVIVGTGFAGLSAALGMSNITLTHSTLSIDAKSHSPLLIFPACGFSLSSSRTKTDISPQNATAKAKKS